MGKKKGSALGYLYLIGMALVAIGFCCPMFSGTFGSTNGFKFINFDKGGFTTIGALLIFAGAVLGIAIVVLSMIGIKLPSLKLLKLIALVVSIVGIIVLIIGINDSKVYKAIAKGMLKHTLFGFWVLVVGFVAAIVGFVMDK